MGRGKKDPFEDLDNEFMDSVAAMSEVEIRQKISSVALNQVALLEAKDNDEDYQQKKEAASVAGEVYRDGTKMNKIRIQFCKRVLGDMGKNTGSFDVEEQE
jgi:hypothetical protein